MLKIFIGLIKTGLCVATLVTSVMLIVAVNPSLRSIRIVAGLIGILVIINTVVIDAISVADALKREFRLVQYQNLILEEVKKNNVQVINLITSQAELLSRMTSIAMKKSPEKQGSLN